ncbi:MAG: YhfC family glutamic-type intramembrane protease [Chloroflexota bacterium]
MLLTAYGISILGMIVLPIVMVIYLKRKFDLPWKLPIAGAVTFILSQVLHIPFLSALTAAFKNGSLPNPPIAWSLPFNAVLLGLLAGIFEETARYILFKFVLKQAKTWRDGVLVGAGHGGIEASLLGLLGIATVVNMVVMKNATDLSAFNIPADQIELAKQQIAAFWSTPVYMAFLGLIERAFAICLHLSLSVMVLYSLAYKKPIWFWIALLWHAIVDGLAVYLMPSLGAIGIEIVVGVLAVISLVILFKMRPLFIQEEPTPQTLQSSSL